MENLSELAPSLLKAPEGYWVASSSVPVSFPARGHDDCFSFEDDSFWFRHRNNVITDAVRRFPPGGAVFDIGGGNGYVAKGLETAGFSSVLVEPGQAGASNALKRGLQDVVCSTLEAANFRPGSLPAAGLFDVLEHVKEEDAFLQSLYSVLRPQGRIYLTVPAFQLLWSTDDVYAGHHRRYTLKSLAASLGRAGFAVEYISYFFWCLAPPVFAFRTIPTWLGFSRSESVDDVRRDHAPRSSLLARVVDRALQAERAWLRAEHVIPVGGSCLAVGRRLKDA